VAVEHVENWLIHYVIPRQTFLPKLILKNLCCDSWTVDWTHTSPSPWYPRSTHPVPILWAGELLPLEVPGIGVSVAVPRNNRLHIHSRSTGSCFAGLLPWNGSPGRQCGQCRPVRRPRTCTSALPVASSPETHRVIPSLSCLTVAAAISISISCRMRPARR